MTPVHPLDDVRDWFETYICVVRETDLDVLALWSAHTHLCEETYVSPRLLLDGITEGCGKTTTLEHLERLSRRPLQMAAVSSAALLTRTLALGIRTLLLDEVDKTLGSKQDYVGDVIAVLNTGYKLGASRPVLVQEGGDWVPREMPTFAPCAMAGTQPDLPNDTLSRSIRVLLMPDVDGVADESDWERIEPDARKLGERLGDWADEVRERVRTTRPALPDGVRGRLRERWAPLKRVADAAGGRWPGAVDALALDDLRRTATDRADGLVTQRPALTLLTHLHEIWARLPSEQFLATELLVAALVNNHPTTWGDASRYGKALTSQRMGRMLVRGYDIRAGQQPDGARLRGYRRAQFEPTFHRLGLA